MEGRRGTSVTASEYFENIERAARDREALAARMRAMSEPHLGSSLSMAMGSGTSDPMARYDAIMDMEPRLRAEAKALDATIHEGREVIDGIGKLLGQPHALALELHYIGLHSWFEISIELKTSMATCYRWRTAAIDLVDERGIGAVKEAGRQG